MVLHRFRPCSEHTHTIHTLSGKVPIVVFSCDDVYAVYLLTYLFVCLFVCLCQWWSEEKSVSGCSAAAEPQTADPG